MKLTFWGAAQTVTGSMHLLEYTGKRVLLDCGLYQGRRAQAKRFNQEFPAPPSKIDAVLLSHAHTDHSGLLPKLFRQSFRGPVLATAATRDLCQTMLADSAHIQQKDADWVNVEVMNSYSAHADEPELVRFIGRLDRKRLKRVFLVHGDPSRQLALRDALAEEGIGAVEAPGRVDEVEL